MNIALWVLQVLLGLAFVFHANLMLRPSPERLQSGMKYVLEMPARLRLFAGITEGLAGLALVFAPLIHVLACSRRWRRPASSFLCWAQSSYTSAGGNTRTSA
jgi:hypothetical protein